MTAHDKAVRAHVAHYSLASRITVGNGPAPLGNVMIQWRAPELGLPIDVIIPTRDNGADLEHAVSSLHARAAAPDGLHIVIVDNGSRLSETAAMIDRLRREYKASVVTIDEPFNWSRLNNQAVLLCEAPLLVFVNDDVTMLSEGWDERLRGMLSRPEIGAVGARLLYPDDTLQHAGVLFGWDGLTIHDGLFESSATAGPASRWHVTRAVSAVTGAFLATRREVFLRQGGFDEIELPVAFSDIDYALKMRRCGLKVLWTPQITLYHFESRTRELDHLDPERRARNATERFVMEQRWGAALAEEPGLHPFWHRATLPFRLLSAPSCPRLWAHIERCAAPNPWIPAMTEHAGPPGRPEKAPSGATGRNSTTRPQGL
jgi:GT2 family glycosyltransferase